MSKKKKDSSSQRLKIMVLTFLLLFLIASILFYLTYIVQRNTSFEISNFLYVLGIVLLGAMTVLASFDGATNFVSKYILPVFTKNKGNSYLNTPKKPKHYIERPESFNIIKNLLLENNESSEQVIGIFGMAGTGKSVLAAALAEDKMIRQAFPDGVIWLTIGQTPDLVSRQQQVASIFDEPEFDIIDTQYGKSILSALLADKKCLIILDDAWEFEHIETFSNLGHNIFLLVTTRNSDIIMNVFGKSIHLDKLEPSEAIKFLAYWSEEHQSKLPIEANDVAKECGYLPLALAMVGALVRLNPDGWKQALHLLRSADLKKLRRKFPYNYEHLLGALEASFVALPLELQEYYESLAVFPPAAYIPEKVLGIFWDLDLYDVRDITEQLVSRSLLKIDHERNYSLHDLQLDYIKSRFSDISSLHSKFIDSFDRAHPDGLHTLPESLGSYFYTYLAYHLAGLECTDRARNIAKEVMFKQTNLGWGIVKSLAKFIDQSLEQIAEQLVEKSKNFIVITASLKILGLKATPQAKKLMKIDGQHPYVVTACLNILGDDAKADAKKILKANERSYQVLIACLKILRDEAKEEAQQLLQVKNQHPHVISVCLKLLSEEAKSVAKDLIQVENQHPDIIMACLDILGEEARSVAKDLLQVKNQHPHVISVCLKMLSEEAESAAKDLVQVENQHPDIVMACLDILGEEAELAAKDLLQVENQHPYIVTACLKILDKEAKSAAKDLLLVENQHPYVVTACLKILDEEAKLTAKNLLQAEKQHPQVITACLHILGEEAKEETEKLINSHEWNQYPGSMKFALLNSSIDNSLKKERAYQILNKWQSLNRSLVVSALKVFVREPNNVKKYCEQILSRWEREISYCHDNSRDVYSEHIIVALNHPRLFDMSRYVAKKMLDKEDNQAGFLGVDLLYEADRIYNGVVSNWEDVFTV